MDPASQVLCYLVMHACISVFSLILYFPPVLQSQDVGVKTIIMLDQQGGKKLVTTFRLCVIV